jgi:hypothetical protein
MLWHIATLYSAIIHAYYSWALFYDAHTRYLDEETTPYRLKLKPDEWLLVVDILYFISAIYLGIAIFCAILSQIEIPLKMKRVVFLWLSIHYASGVFVGVWHYSRQVYWRHIRVPIALNGVGYLLSFVTLLLSFLAENIQTSLTSKQQEQEQEQEEQEKEQETKETAESESKKTK